MISKLISFENGSARLELTDGILQLTLQSGSVSWKLSSNGFVTMRPVSCLNDSVTAQILSGRISAEETENGLTLHTNPTDANGKPFPAFMVHYRVEAVGNCALRFSCWIGSREPVLGSLSWLPFKAIRKNGLRVHGFQPAYDADATAVAHGMRFEDCAIYDENGFLTLSGGDVRFLSESGTDAQENPLCALIPACGELTGQNLADFNEKHPLSMVLSWGVGKPFLPEQIQVKAACKPVRKAEIVHTLTSGRLTMAVTEYARGVLMNAVRMDSFGYSETEAGELARVTVKSLKTGEVCTLTSAHDWETVRVRKLEGNHTSSLLSVYLANTHGIRLAVSVEMRVENADMITFRTKILNSDEEWTVLSANYPEIRFANGENLSFFRPSSSGIVESNADRRQYRWNGIYLTGFEGVSPVLGVYDPKKSKNSGLYTAIHAPFGARTDMSAALFQDGSGRFSFEYAAENMGRPANAFSLNGSLVLKVLDGNWYDMAKIYGDYIESHAVWVRPKGRPDSPQWMKDVPLYVMDWMPNDNPDADPVPVSIRPPIEPPRDNWYRKPSELADRLGLPIGYHLYNWHFIPFNNDYPYYFPVKEGLEEGVEELHRHGVHVMPYINGRIADIRDTRGENIRFDRDLASGATRSPDGSLNPETYASHEPDGELCKLAAMCPTAPAWRKLMAETVRRLFLEYHMDAVYIDQVSTARPNACCAPNHNHAPGGGTWWNEAYRLLMEQLRQEAPEGCGFTSESNSECYADMFDGFLTWAWVQPHMVPFFPKLYAGRITLLGRNTNGYKKRDAQYFRFHVAQAVMFGQVIGWTNADVVDDAEKIEFLSRMCHLRWDTREYYTTGDMLRPAEVCGSGTFLTDNSMGREEMVPAPYVVASGWRGADKSTLICAANSGTEAAKVTLTLSTAEYDLNGVPKIQVYGSAEIEEIRDNVIRLNLDGMSAVSMIWA